MKSEAERMDTDKLIETTRARILVVDDDPGNLDILVRLLHPHYNVLAATSGERALRIATREPEPDLILLDVLMPGMDGYDVLARLRDNPATRNIPVIFVTGLDSIEDEEKGLELGAVDYITKPYRPPIILARVRTRLELKRARDFLANYNRILEEQVETRTAELRESEERFRAMSASAQDAIVMIDNDGNISFWNAAAETIFGYSNQEAQGRNLHALLAPERFQEAHRKGFEHFLQSGEGAMIGKTLELAAVHKGGAKFPIELSLSAMKINGKWCAVGIMRDITKRKQAVNTLRRERNQHKALAHKLQETEQQMIQSAKMAAVGTLAAGIAHEINNPASYIYSNVVTLRGYIQRLMRLLDTYEKIGALLPEEMRQAAEELESVRQQVNVERLKADLPAIMAETLEGIDRITRIVSDLKSFSHLDAEESWQPADLNQALDTTLNVVWNELKYKAEIHKEYGDLPPVTCLISQISQVFMNLLVNAAQAIGEHGIITLRTGVAGEEVWVEIADTGSGIPKQYLSRIFVPFFTTKPAGSGTGLGLWITHGIVDKHQGRIEVVSEEGVGTTFKVWLPIHPVPES